MKQAALWLLPAVALASVGSLTYATSRPTHEEEGKKSDIKVVTKIVPFAHDTEIDKYLTSIRSFMLVPPRNGQFGAMRIPTFHGASKSSIPGYKEVQLLGEDFSFSSSVVGTLPNDSLDAYKQYKVANTAQNIQVPTYRVTSSSKTKFNRRLSSESSWFRTLRKK
jgi:hypothetical protein